MTRLAEVKTERDAAKREAERLWLLVNDLVSPTPKLGEPIRVTVRAGEVETRADHMAATIYRPRGADPTVVLVMNHDSVHVRVWDDWQNQAPDPYDLTMNVLRERARVAFERAMRG